MTTSSAPVATKLKRVLVLGYYNKRNYGDDVFVEVLAREWGAHELCIRNMEDVVEEEVRGIDLIVLGGGDVLNAYFMQQLERFVLPYRNRSVPIYAVGVSAPYQSAVDSGMFDIIDRFWGRFQEDVASLQPRYGDAVQHIPDLALAQPSPVWQPRSGTIGICLARSIINGNTHELLPQISNLIRRLADAGWRIYWIAFNNDSNERESDVALLKMLSERRRVTVLCERNIAATMAEMQVVIASRFHANVFSTMMGVPCVSIEQTRKVHEWNRDAGVSGIALRRKCDCSDGCGMCRAYIGPVAEFPVEEIMQRIDELVASPPPLLTAVRRRRRIVQRVLASMLEAPSLRTGAPYAVDRTSTLARAVALYNSHTAKVCSVEQFSRALCGLITGDAEYPFLYGLMQNASRSSFNLQEAVNWMMCEYSRNPPWNRVLTNNPDGLFALHLCSQQRLQGVHRVGWAAVLDQMRALHREDAPLMDTFIDRTFGWQAEDLESAGIIPYRTPWFGFIHHPVHAIRGPNDCEHMVVRRAFQQSLATCRGLFVMASDLRDWLRAQAECVPELAELARIPIHVVLHPTDAPDLKFTWSAWLARERSLRRIVQVGSWCREPSAIFRLRTDIGRAALRTNEIREHMQQCQDAAARDPTMLVPEFSDVELLDHLSNDEYDRLLAENIVLLPLGAVVACNTLLECIVRNTPVLVPRLPGVVEYLGADYPLYYESNECVEGAGELLEDDTVHAAHLYLQRLDKSRFTNGAFLESVRRALS
jgi:hypothetical protein